MNYLSKMLVSIKEVAVRTALDSTAHGIPSIQRNENWFLKILWIVCFVASCGFCGYLLFKGVNDYLEYEVVTTVKKIGETPTTFPTVTLCNDNLITNQKAFDFASQFAKDFVIEYDDDTDFIRCP
jgi:hypothetical protein